VVLVWEKQGVQCGGTVWDALSWVWASALSNGDALLVKQITHPSIHPPKPPTNRPLHQFNEPMSICQLGYGIGVFAPGVEGGTAAQYKCGHHLLIAHGKAVQLYRGKYQKQQGVSHEFT